MVTLNDKHIEYLNEISNNSFKDMKNCSGEYTIALMMLAL